jgi:hypothetical protein
MFISPWINYIFNYTTPPSIIFIYRCFPVHITSSKINLPEKKIRSRSNCKLLLFIFYERILIPALQKSYKLSCTVDQFVLSTLFIFLSFCRTNYITCNRWECHQGNRRQTNKVNKTFHLYSRQIKVITSEKYEFNNRIISLPFVVGSRISLCLLNCSNSESIFAIVSSSLFCNTACKCLNREKK